MLKHTPLHCLVLTLSIFSGSALRAAPAFRATQEADATLGNSMTPAGEIIEPRDIVADFPRRKIYVVDALRNRVLRFAVDENMRPAKTAEAVFGQMNFENSFAAAGANSFSGCSGACVDHAGRLWVADTENHRVLRFDDAWKRNSGAAANAVLGQPTFLAKETGAAANRMNRPHSVTVSTAGELYVADTNNHRVLRFNNAAGKANGAVADGVLGQAGFGLSFSGITAGRLNGPQGLALARSDVYVNDNTAHLYVADTNNHRVLRFDRPAALVNGASAAVVLGQPSFTANISAVTAVKMNRPKKLCVSFTSLFVADSGNNRVLNFFGVNYKASGDPADSVTGQGSFTTAAAGAGMLRMSRPEAVFVDHNSCLWIGEAGNARITLRDGVHSLEFDQQADGVLGALALKEVSHQAIAPGGLAVCPLTGKLFVSDTGKNRVFRYKHHKALATGVAPEAVLGQSSLTAEGSGTAAMRMDGPLGICVDKAGRLWVADAGNHRVLRFDKAAAADAVLGQALFTHNYSGNGAAQMNRPSAVSADAAGRLWVSDTGNNRVLRFDNAAAKSDGAAANGWVGQPTAFSSVPATSASGLRNPADARLDGAGRLWIADRGNHRLVRYNQPSAAFAAARLGQGEWNSVEGQGSTGLHRLTPSALLPTSGPDGLWVADAERGRVLRFTPVKPEITGVGLNNQGKLRLTLEAVAGETYRLRVSGNLQHWTAPVPVTATADTMLWTDPAPVGTGRKFYRIEEVE